MNRKQSPKLFTKEMSVGGHKVTLYSLDEVTWSSNPDEPLQLQSRQEEGRLQLQVKVQSVPKEKHSGVAGGNLRRSDLGEDEPFEAEDDDLKEDVIEVDVHIEELDEDEDEIPVKEKGGSSPRKEKEIVNEGGKGAPVASIKAPKSSIVTLEEKVLPAKEKREKEEKVSGKAVSPKTETANLAKKNQTASKKASEKKVVPAKVVPVVKSPKAKAAKVKGESNTKPAKKSPSSAKKIEAPQKGKTVNVKVSPGKGKSPGKKG